MLTPLFVCLCSITIPGILSETTFLDVIEPKAAASRNTTINETESSKNTSVNETTEIESPRKSEKSPSPNTTVSQAPTTPQPFRLPPIDMANSSFKLAKTVPIMTPVTPPVIAKVNPVQVHVPTPPTSPMPADSPTISQASSNESLFDNVKKVAPNSPKLTKVPTSIAYSSIARKLFPLNSEFLSFLAKEGLHQDWQIYTLNNRAIEAFLYKYVIFITGVFRK